MTFVAISWALNHFLIISRILNRLSRLYDSLSLGNVDEYGERFLVEEQGNGAATVAVVANQGREGNVDGRGIQDRLEDGATANTPEQVLSLVYYEIYSQPAELYVQSESSRAWMWLCLAILLNVVFIKLELLLFQDIIRENSGIIKIP